MVFHGIISDIFRYVVTLYTAVKSLLDPWAIQHMAMHVMFRRDLNELKVSRKAERPHVRPRVGLSAFAYIYDYIYIQIIFLDFLHQKYTASHGSPICPSFPSLGVPRPSFWPRRSSSWPWPDAWEIRSAASRHRRATVEPLVGTEAGLFCSNWV